MSVGIRSSAKNIQTQTKHSKTQPQDSRTTPPPALTPASAARKADSLQCPPPCPAAANPKSDFEFVVAEGDDRVVLTSMLLPVIVMGTEAAICRPPSRSGTARTLHVATCSARTGQVDATAPLRIGSEEKVGEKAAAPSASANRARYFAAVLMLQEE